MLIKLKIILKLFLIEQNIITILTNEITNRCINLINPATLRYEKNINNDGFHKNYKINLQINTNDIDYLKNYCNLMIVQKFNSNFYVDEFELRQSIYNQAFLFFLSQKVNTESIEYRSESFMLVLIIKKKILSCDQQSNYCNISFAYPFHLRYHAPSEKYLNQRFKLNSPRLLASDCNEDLSMQKEFFFKLNEKFDAEFIKDFFFKNCFWTEISEYYSENEFELAVPVGNANFSHIVIPVTLGFLIILALYVSNLFREKSLEFNIKND